MIGRRLILRLLEAFVVLLAGSYAVDLLYVHLQSPARAYGAIQVNHYLITPLKNGRDEYDYTGSEMKTCVRSLYPHSGYQPCWYLKRHTEQNEKYGALRRPAGTANADVDSSQLL